MKLSTSVIEVSPIVNRGGRKKRTSNTFSGLGNGQVIDVVPGKNRDQIDQFDMNRDVDILKPSTLLQIEDMTKPQGGALMKGSRSRGNLLPSLSGGGGSLAKKEEAATSNRNINLSPLQGKKGFAG